MEQQRRKSALGGWLFLLSVLAAYGVTGAVVTGLVSGLIVVDIDPAHGGEESLAALSGHLL